MCCNSSQKAVLALRRHRMLICVHTCCARTIHVVQTIPKLLWELGSTKPATSHIALGLLHSALCFAPAGSALSAALDGLQPQLCPLYCSLLAPRSAKGGSKAGGDGAKPGKVVVPGPLARMPAHTQVTRTHCLAPDMQHRQRTTAAHLMGVGWCPWGVASSLPRLECMLGIQVPCCSFIVLQNMFACSLLRTSSAAVIPHVS